MTTRASTIPTFPARFGLALLLTAAADVLLFDRPLGVGLVLSFILTAVGCVMANRRGRVPTWPVVLLALGLIPLAENVSLLSATFALLGLALFALWASRRLRRGIGAAARQLGGLAVSAPFGLLTDLRAWRRARSHTVGFARRAGGFLGWALALILTLLFSTLFAIANPVVERLFSLLDIGALLGLLEFDRIVFWLIALAGIWILLRPRLSAIFRARHMKVTAAPVPRRVVKVPANLSAEFLGPAAVLRALLVLNLLFAVQTLLDAAYLWGGIALPDGLTYAGYAHRGAYLLIVTAVLAAAIILVFMRRGSLTAADKHIRGLVYLWTAQNIVLVLSSILRLDLYVGIYSLTYWRVAAFIWMGLVAVGLGLIIVRIAKSRTNGWLIGANLVALAATLYACCFVNFGGLIARYNVLHSFEVGGGGQPLDLEYLVSLGSGAVPAIDLYAAATATPIPYLQSHRNVMVWEIRERLADWRSWTLRGYRLIRYVDATAAERPSLGAAQP